MKSLKKVFFMLLVVVGVCSVLKTDVSAYEKKQDSICQTGWSDTSITVEWPVSKKNPAEYWKVFIYDKNNNNWKYVDTTTSLCYTFNNLEPGTDISVGVVKFPQYDQGLSEEEYIKEYGMTYTLNHVKTTISNISGDITYKWYEKGKILKFFLPDYGKDVTYVWRMYNNDNKLLQKYESTYPTAFMVFGGCKHADEIIKCSLEVVTTIPDPNSMYSDVDIHSNKIWYTHVMQSSPKRCKVAKNNKSFKLTWHKIKGATGYEVWCSTKPRSGYKKVKTLGKNTTSYTVKKVKGKKVNAKRTYYYYIKTKCGNKTSDVYYAWSTKKGTKKPAVYLGD